MKNTSSDGNKECTSTKHTHTVDGLCMIEPMSILYDKVTSSLSGMEWESSLKSLVKSFLNYINPDDRDMAHGALKILISQAISEVYKKSYIKGEEEGFISGQNYPRTDENTKRLLGEARADERRKVVEQVRKEIRQKVFVVEKTDWEDIVTTVVQVLSLPSLSLTKETE